MAQEPDRAGLRVELDQRRLDPVGERERRRVGDVVAGRRQLRLDARRQRVLAEMADPGELGEAHPPPPRRPVEDAAAAQRQRRRLGLEDRRGQREDVGGQRVGGPVRGLAADRKPARRPGAAAIGHRRRVAALDPDVAGLHAEPVGDDLGDPGQRALAELDRRGRAAHRPRRVEAHRRAVLGADPRFGRAVIGGADRGHLDEGGDADPLPDAAPAQLGLAAAQPRIVHRLDQPVEARLQAQPGHREARRGGQRVGVGPVVVAPAHLHGVDPRLGRRPVEQLLGDGAGDRLADAAVHARRRLVLEHRAQPPPIGAVGVGRGGHRDDHHPFRDRRAPPRGIGADRNGGVHAHPDDPPGGVDADLGLHRLVAGLDVGEEGLHPVGGVFDRLAEQDRQRRHRDLVAIDVQLDAEPAADVRRDHPHRALGQAEQAGQRVLLLPGRLMGAVDRQPPLAGVEIGDDDARLQRNPGLAREGEAAGNDVRGPGEDGVDVAGAALGRETEIAAEPGMDERRAVLERPALGGDGRQRFVVHPHRFGGVLGLGAAGGDDRGHRLALPGRAVDGDRVLRRRDQPRQVGGRALPRRADFRDLGPGDHARPRRLRRLDAEDARMGVRAAHEDGVAEPGEAQVVGVAAAPRGEAPRRAARQGAADRVVSHRSGSPSPFRRRRRWRGSRCSGSNCRTGILGSRPGSSCGPGLASPGR